MALGSATDPRRRAGVDCRLAASQSARPKKHRREALDACLALLDGLRAVQRLLGFEPQGFGTVRVIVVAEIARLEAADDHGAG